MSIWNRDFSGTRCGANIAYARKASDDYADPIPMEVDDSGSLVTIGHAHSKVHQGTYYNASHYFSAVSNNADALLLLKLGSKSCHSVIQIGITGDSILKFHEAPTLTADGTSISVVNHNRTKALQSPAYVATTTAFHTPTIGDSPLNYGTPLIPGFVLPGGTKDKGGGAIAEASGEQWVLAASTNYLIRVTNISGSAQNISIDIAFYEV